MKNQTPQADGAHGHKSLDKRKNGQNSHDYFVKWLLGIDKTPDSQNDFIDWLLAIDITST